MLAARSLQDGVVRVLKHIGVREVSQSNIPIRARPPERAAEEYSTISKAQALVDFPIQAPGYLPPGFRLEGVQVLGLSAVALNYRRDPDGGRYRAELVGILQYRPKEEKQNFFEIGEGTSEEIILNGKPAILVAGRGWARGVRWQRSEGYGVIWEEEDLVFSIWSTLSREETLRVAESVR